MLSSIAIVETVADSILRHGISKVVVDPVMVAKSGDRLLREEAIGAVRSRLLPLASLVTPNIPEAEDLTGMTVKTDNDVRRVAQAILDMGPQSVVIKGGHRNGPPTDVYFDGEEFLEFIAERIPTANTHGTGCTFASAAASYLAHGKPVVEAVELAKRYVTRPYEHRTRWAKGTARCTTFTPGGRRNHRQ